MQLRHAPAAARNREPILDVLKRVLPQDGLLLEIASGTGEHAAFIAPRLPGTLVWQPTDASPEALEQIDGHASLAASHRIRPALLLDVTSPEWPVARADALLCCNMIHIAPWAAAEALFAGAARLLPPGGPFVLYGPFRRFGRHTAASNENFDAGLRARDPRWGVRCLDTELMPLAERCGLELDDLVSMPANNRTVIWRKSA